MQRAGRLEGRERTLLWAGAITIAFAFVARPIFEATYFHQSWWINWSWLDQFAEQILRGEAYPQWLERSHGGLGAPSFYFYPPLAFYAGVPFVAAGFSVDQALIAVNALIVIISAFTAHAWFRAAGKHALLPALLYASAPFFLFDLLYRGAIAEQMAYAWLPLMGLGILRAHQGRGGWVAALAVTLMLLSHLLIAMVAVLLLAVPYALSLSRRPADWWRMGWPFAVGLLVASLFVLPAIALESHRSSEVLWGRAYFQPAFWNLLIREWDAFIGPLVAILALGAAGAAWLFVRTKHWAAALAVACALVSLGAVPLFELPLLSRIQFPFRASGFVTLWTAFALSQLPKPDRATVLAAALAHVMVPVMMVTEVREPSLDPDFIRANHADVVEMLPPGAIKDDWTGNGRRDAVAVRSVAEADPSVAPRYYFPIWIADCDGRRVAVAQDESGLVRLPEARCTVERRTLAVEWWARGLSLLGLVLLLWMARSGRSHTRTRPLRG